MISLAEAWSRLEPHLDPLPAERLPRRACLGRVLAEGLSATVDVPHADVSAMDGYAYAGDLEPGSRLPVGERIAAGDAPGRELPPGSALPIMTGAPVPLGADRVVRFEDTERIEPGGERRAAGGDPGAAAGRRQPAPPRRGARRRSAPARLRQRRCRRPPWRSPPPTAWRCCRCTGRRAVAVLPTGDEVVAPETTPAPGQLRDTHTDFLLASGRRLGLDFQPLGIAPDDPSRAARLLARGLATADVLLVGGGCRPASSTSSRARSPLSAAAHCSPPSRSNRANRWWRRCGRHPKTRKGAAGWSSACPETRAR